MSDSGPDPAPSREESGPPPAAAPRPWRERLRHRLPFATGIAVGVVLALLASALVAALSGPGDLEVDDEYRALVIVSGRDDSLDGQRRKLVEEWNVLHPEQQARIVELSGIADAQRAEMLARAQADDGGVDVYNLDVTWTAEFADAGHIASLDEPSALTAGFLPGPLSTCRYDGRLWALPFNTDVGLLYYRTDLLAEIGERDPPQTWDDLLAYAQRVRSLKGDGIAAYAGQFADYEGLTVTALELVWGAGGTVVDGDGDVLPDDGDVAALRTGLGRLEDLAPELPPLDEAESRRAFRKGQALFMRNWPVAYRSLRQDTEEGAPVPFAVAPLPGGSAALGGQNLAVSARTTRPRAARALIEFLTSERSEQLLFERGGLPATRDVVYTGEQPTPELRDLAPTLRSALAQARGRPSVPHYAEFSAAFRSVVDGSLRRDEPPAADAVRDQLEAALEGRPSPGG